MTVGFTYLELQVVVVVVVVDSISYILLVMGTVPPSTYQGVGNCALLMPNRHGVLEKGGSLISIGFQRS